MNLAEHARPLLDYLITAYVVDEYRERMSTLLDTKRGTEKLRAGLCHFQNRLRLDLGRKPTAEGWWRDLKKQIDPAEILVFGSKRFEVMPFGQAKDGVGICSFVVDVQRRFAVYVGDAGDDLIFYGKRGA